TAVSPQGFFPFPAWIEGLLFQMRHGREGHASYLFGATSSEGWWWFYLACLAFKVTVGAQAIPVLRLAAVVARARGGRELHLRGDAALLAYPAFLLVAMSAGKHQPNIGF